MNALFRGRRPGGHQLKAQLASSLFEVSLDCRVQPGVLAGAA
jgi:hypothetical protein